VDTEVPSPQAGILTETLVAEGDTVEVGTTIARVETEAEEAEVVEPSDSSPDEAAEERSEFAPPEVEEEDESAPEPEPAEAAAEAPDTSGGPAPSGDEVEVVMPKMGESITEGTVIAWYKDVGEEVKVDETLLEIGTDKVDTEVPSPAAGVVTEKLVDEGETVEVGTVVALLASEADADAVEAPTPEAPDEQAEVGDAEDSGLPSTSPSGDGAMREAEGPDQSPEETIKRRGSDGRFYSPLVRSIAKEEGLRMSELETLEGSGRGGRVTKEDVLAYLEEREEAPAEPAGPARPPNARPVPVHPAKISRCAADTPWRRARAKTSSSSSTATALRSSPWTGCAR